MPTTQPPSPSSAQPVQHFGPDDAEIGKIKQVPPHPTVPYTLGQTPRQQNRIIIIGVATWLAIAVLVLKGYIF